MKNFLEKDERIKLEEQHRKERDGRIKDRIKAVLARDAGAAYEDIAFILRVDVVTVRRFVDEYIDSKKVKPQNGGSSPKLDEKQTKELIKHLQENLYQTVKAIRAYVYKTFRVKYSRQGMTDWLIRNNFGFKKATGIPRKADPKKQAEFVEEYKKLKENLPENEVILFCDSVHPNQATKLTYGWIYKGTQALIPTSAGRKRLNVSGTINLETMNLVLTQEETKNITSEVFIEHLKEIEKTYPDAKKIHVFGDNAPYQTSKEVKAYLETSRIVFHYIPVNSPNLNPIERLWKVFHRHVSNNRYYQTFSDFKKAARAFFTKTYNRIKYRLTKEINDNFQTLPTTISLINVI